MLNNKIECLLLLTAISLSIITSPRTVFSNDVPWYQPTTITHFYGHRNCDRI